MDSKPSTPLKKLKNPFLRRPRLTQGSPFRTRATARASLSVVLIVVLVCIFSELHCVEHGCLSRVGFYGGRDDTRGGHVGGGAVLGPPRIWQQEVKDKERELDWDQVYPDGEIGGYYGAYDSEGEGVFEDDHRKEKSVLVGVDGGAMDLEMMGSSNTGPQDTKGMDKDLGDQVAKHPFSMQKLQSISPFASASPPSKTVDTLSTIPFPTPKISPPAKSKSKPTPTSALPIAPPQPPASTSLSYKSTKSFDWVGREDDPPPAIDEMEGHFRKMQGWEQGEGQEDPVRVSSSADDDDEEEGVETNDDENGEEEEELDDEEDEGDVEKGLTIMDDGSENKLGAMVMGAGALGAGAAT